MRNTFLSSHLSVSSDAEARHGLSRRRFLATGAAVIAGVGVGGRSAHAMSVELPRGLAAGRTRADSWLADPPRADHLRHFAQIAVDAARGAGADFADVRIGVRRRLLVYAYPDGTAVVGQAVGYGVRAWHNGTWSFQHGNVLTADAIAATARSAAAGARLYAGIDAQLGAHRHAAPSGFAPGQPWAASPMVTGEWRAPAEIDPFTVPIDDIQRAFGALRHVHAPDELVRATQAHVRASNGQWFAETRVFASMAGSLVTQHTIDGGFDLVMTINTPDRGIIQLREPAFTQRAGLEVMFRPEVPERIQQLYDTAVHWGEIPFRPFGDVGRFPIVVDGSTMAGIVGSTVDTALDGDRVSGVESDASGSSFLAPALEVLDAAAPQFSPLLSAHVDRAVPSQAAVQWDDDGVVPESYQVLDNGRVVDFHTTRETAPMLVDWYARHGRPVRSHGTAVAPTADCVPYGGAGHFTVTPSAKPMNIDGLMRDVGHGFLVIHGIVGASPGLTAGRIAFDVFDGIMAEIRHGVPVARTVIKLQFTTRQLLGKNLLALGDASTQETSTLKASKGMPWQQIEHPVTAPAALFADVDVIL